VENEKMPRKTERIDDERIEEFLSLKGTGATQRAYRRGLRLFIDYYRGKYGEDEDFNSFLERIFDNLKKPLNEQRRIIEPEFVGFIEYLKLKYANKSVRVYLAGIQNYLKYRNVAVSLAFVGNLPQDTTLKVNEKHEWKIEHVKEFVNQAKTHREKAIILCLFQSGMGINELLSLNYGDTQDELEKKIVPIHLRLVRKKTGVEYRTFFGRDAVKYLSLYLETRQGLRKDAPLFTKWGSNTERLTKEAVDKKFRENALNLDFIEEEDLENGYNPARPHSLRAAFRSRLTGKVADPLIEFWMGHAIGEQVRSYLNLPTEDLRELYVDAEKYLAIEKTSREELEERKGKVLKVNDEYEKRIEKLEGYIGVLQGENTALKTDLEKVKLEHAEMKRKIEVEIAELRKHLEE